MKPANMTAVIGGRRYKTQAITLLASDCYWDGKNYDRNGRNRFLFRTPNGRYFMQYQTCWQGEINRIEAISEEEAIRIYKELPESRLEFEEAFPGRVAEEA